MTVCECSLCVPADVVLSADDVRDLVVLGTAARHGQSSSYSPAWGDAKLAFIARSSDGSGLYKLTVGGVVLFLCESMYLGFRVVHPVLECSVDFDSVVDEFAKKANGFKGSVSNWDDAFLLTVMDMYDGSNVFRFDEHLDVEGVVMLVVDDVPTGRCYVLSSERKAYRWVPRVVWGWSW